MQKVALKLRRGFTIFFSKNHHLQTVDARGIKWSKFHTEDPQMWSDPWTSLSRGSFCSVRVKLFVRKEDHDNYSENIRRNQQNFNCIHRPAAWYLCSTELGKDKRQNYLSLHQEGTYGRQKCRSFILNLELNRTECFTLRFGRFTAGRGPGYPLTRRIGGYQSRSGLLVQGKNLLPMPGNESRIFQPIT
jgi:hypothetical protein